MGKDHPGNHITKNRSCTDVLCVLVFIVFLGGWVGVGVIGLLDGHPEQLVYPSNSRGELCGRGVHEDKPYVLFHDPTQCLSVSAIFGCPTPQICVESCPDQTTSLYAYALYKSGAGGTFDQFDADYQRQFCVPEVSEQEWAEAKVRKTKELMTHLHIIYTHLPDSRMMTLGRDSYNLLKRRSVLHLLWRVARLLEDVFQVLALLRLHSFCKY